MPTITEKQVRQMVANQINQWMGATRGSSIHRKILDTYNTYPAVASVPGSYRMKVSDAWCACTASAVMIILGFEKYTGYNISCNTWIDIAKSMGIWQEDESIMPGIGDLTMYDWDDPKATYATTNNRGKVEHVGIVTGTETDRFYVTEGNMTDASKVGVRILKKNGRYLRGFIRPNYGKIAELINNGTIPYPTIRADGGYDNGSLTTEQVKELQKHHRLTLDGYWGPGSKRLTGMTADEAWARYKGITTPASTTSTPSGYAKTNPYPVPTRVLKQGCIGNDVKWLQYQLHRLRFGTAGVTLEKFVDGSMGPGTVKSLKAFQSTYGLVADGSCGPVTLAKLKSL